MEKHTHKEDWIAILTGTFLVAQGVFFLQSAHLLTGGTTGLALLMSQFVSLSFGTLYFIANSPFYLLAWKRFGSRFAFNSVISGALVSIFTDHLYLVISLDAVNTIYCAVAGGLLMGLGMLILFRHRSSLGGFNVLCLFIQDKFGISVGKTQLAIDGCILAASCFFVSPLVIGLSIFGAVLLNMVLAMNHKPTRYSVNYR
ncbi:YitT family protein [Vibrio ostreicida]|uniref:YitT family protein n=1 Tax=Vibrio ostreicida TaxID=526588 RepID=A0ABT8BVG1_9VIBR|nr:YitT family protein [Vibrio ostreicida]MDN3609291.1 YitT family protein [Vibrio ostreicida]MDN3611115.1 YitT family protein [Vibrio ostreicida]NPD08182.1 YitT family protein [Vibrio ostreicida]